MHLIVCYDVVDDRRRQRLHKRLKGLLEPVQKSVFEGTLPSQRYRDVVSAIVDSFDPQTDTVRVYNLCGACQTATDLFGIAHAVATEPEDIII